MQYTVLLTQSRKLLNWKVQWVLDLGQICTNCFGCKYFSVLNWSCLVQLSQPRGPECWVCTFWEYYICSNTLAKLSKAWKMIFYPKIYIYLVCWVPCLLESRHPFVVSFFFSGALPLQQPNPRVSLQSIAYTSVFTSAHWNLYTNYAHRSDIWLNNFLHLHSVETKRPECCWNGLSWVTVYCTSSIWPNWPGRSWLGQSSTKSEILACNMRMLLLNGWSSESSAWLVRFPSYWLYVADLGQSCNLSSLYWAYLVYWILWNTLKKHHLLVLSVAPIASIICRKVFESKTIT